MAEVTVFAALGTNLGEKLSNLEAAIDMLNALAGRVLETSRLYCTAPQYVEDQPSFFNLVLKMTTTLSPQALLESFKTIEREIGRVQSFRYGPRLIDVDVLFYGDAVVTTETVDGQLIVPHERIHERDFVLAPFCDIAPEFVHPGFQLTMQELYAQLIAASQNRDGNAYVAPVAMLPVIKSSPWQLGSKTFVMGILNVTPDSFSDGADLKTAQDAIERALDMERKGVDILDIGGESSRPGAEPVTLEEELKRVIPVIQGIRAKSAIPISIDTMKAEVARQAIEAGANVVNDISAGLKDANMLATVAKLRVPIILMHMRGTPKTMSGLMQYEDLVAEVAEVLNERVQAAIAAGNFTWNVVVDPGIGFAKKGELNLQLLRNLAQVKKSCRDLPMLVGASRKGFIGTICGRPDPKDRAWGTAATCCAAIAEGADILRVHDGPEMVDVAKMSDAIWRKADEDYAQDNLRDVEPASYSSETPHFDGLFARYDVGNGSVGTEHLGSLLLDMGFNATPRVLDRALDDMDPNATGEISKLTFLEWFEENADDIEAPQPMPTCTTPRNHKDDESTCQLQSAMLDAKNARKCAETDVQLLANRLSHLRQEEARAQRRIEEANRRANEIEAVKKRNQEHQRAKQRMFEQMQREIKQACESNNMAVALSRERKHQNLSIIHSMRSQLVQETREERQANLAAIQRKRDKDQYELVQRSKEIRSQEQSALKRREVLKKKQEKELHKKAHESLAFEFQKKLMSEKLVKQMEDEEAQLIEKLRITQEMQRAAYEHLEFVMEDD